MKKILIIGATSAIAEQCARGYAAEGERLHLLARSPEKLAILQSDLLARGAAEVSTGLMDALDTASHAPAIAEALQQLDGLDICLVAHGTLGEQEACAADYALAEKEFQANFLSVVSLLTPVSAFMQQQGAGCIAVISSVAGVRGRQSNFIYGAAKGGLNIYLEGLRNQLAHQGVHVLTILPGFVDTPMTADLPKTPLFASAEKVARGIRKAIRKKRNTVYLPGFWWGIMTLIRHVPEPIFKKLKL